MQLNKSSYETIFLLYIDNELSTQERMEVEAFIAANPSYASELEALKATQLRPEKILYAFKENLKKQEVETNLEALEAVWDPVYSTILKADMQAIPGLSTTFKNALKKEMASEGILIKPFGFNQNKFTYAAIAACLMVFLGYQQLTKTLVSDSPTANSSASNSVVAKTLKVISTKTASKTLLANTTIEKKAALIQATTPIQTKKVQKYHPVVTNHQSLKAFVLQQSTNDLMKSTEDDNFIASNSATSQNIVQKKIDAFIAPVESYSALNNTNILPNKIISKLSNTSILTNDADEDQMLDANAPMSYEVIDTDDPERTIYIVNFEIDGNKFRGLKRKVSSLFKNNKSERKL